MRAQNIPGFLKEFAGEVDMSEAAEPVESFKTFNDFFVRKLKPSARPIASPDHPEVLVSAADCRLTAWLSVDDATRCWIKARSLVLGSASLLDAQHCTMLYLVPALS